MLNHGVAFNLGSAKVFSNAIFETYFSYEKDKWIAVTYYYILLLNFTIFNDSSASVKTFGKN